MQAGFWHADGLAGDLGGGSLELIDVRHHGRVGQGVSLPIGVLALSDLSRESPKRAVRIVREALTEATPLAGLKGRTFYAVGGTWRALAKLHMAQRDYPLNVMHGYVMSGAEPGAFTSLVERAEPENPAVAVPSARRPLLAYGAILLDEIVRVGRPREVVVSTFGVREGLLYGRMPAAERAADPLLTAARDLDLLRSRSPGHGDDLCAWTDLLIATCGLAETEEQRRLRHAACLLSDTAWRAHPDYRSASAFNTVANGAFVSIDHAGRGFLALTMMVRHEGADAPIAAPLRALAATPEIERARLLGAAMRVAYQVSAGMRGVLPRVTLEGRGSRLVLTLPPDLGDLDGLRLQNRMKQVARLLGRESAVAIA